MRGSTILCLGLAGGLAVSAAPLAAQPPCSPDLRWTQNALSKRAVKVELASGQRYSPLREVVVGADSLAGRFRGERIEVPTTDVRRIEILSQRHPAARFLRGLAIGVGVGAAVYLTFRNDPIRARSSVIPAGAAIGGTIGGIVGLAAPALDSEVLCETPAAPPP